VLSFPETSSKYMPVTREISADTHKMLEMWVDRPIYDKTVSIKDYFPDITKV
jgi:hypothetical protein